MYQPILLGNCYNGIISIITETLSIAMVTKVDCTIKFSTNRSLILKSPGQRFWFPQEMHMKNIKSWPLMV
jgi:hypothetical protein